MPTPAPTCAYGSVRVSLFPIATGQSQPRSTYRRKRALAQLLSALRRAWLAQALIMHPSTALQPLGSHSMKALSPAQLLSHHSHGVSALLKLSQSAPHRRGFSTKTCCFSSAQQEPCQLRGSSHAVATHWSLTGATSAGYCTMRSTNSMHTTASRQHMHSTGQSPLHRTQCRASGGVAGFDAQSVSANLTESGGVLLNQPSRLSSQPVSRGCALYPHETLQKFPHIS